MTEPSTIPTIIRRKEQPMTVRVKVVCSNKTLHSGSTPADAPISQLHFHPVYSGSEENKRFFASTPGGMFSFYTINQEAAAQFQIGKEYYFDIFAAE